MHNVLHEFYEFDVIITAPCRAGAARAGQADQEPTATRNHAETTQAASGEGSWTYRTYPAETEHRNS